MKLMSGVVISKLFAVGFGLFVVGLGLIACYTGRAVGVYRRPNFAEHKLLVIGAIKMAKNMSMKGSYDIPKPGGRSGAVEQDLEYDIYSDYSDYWGDDYQRYPEDYWGKEDNSREEGRVGTDDVQQDHQASHPMPEDPPIGSLQAVHADLDGNFTEKQTPIKIHHHSITVWTIVVLAVVFFSVFNLSLTLGEPETSGKLWGYCDKAMNVLSGLALIAVGILLIVVLILAVNKKKKYIKTFMVDDPRFRPEGLQSWWKVLDACHVDPEDVRKTYNKIGTNDSKKVAQKMFETYEKEMMRPYKDDQNFDLQIAAGVMTILCGFVFIVVFVMTLIDKKNETSMRQEQPMNNGNDQRQYGQGRDGSMVDLEVEGTDTLASVSTDGEASVVDSGSTVDT